MDFYFDQDLEDLDPSTLTTDQRQELRDKLREAKRDPRYADPALRQTSWVNAINKAYKKLYPEK